MKARSLTFVIALAIAGVAGSAQAQVSFGDYEEPRRHCDGGVGRRQGLLALRRTQVSDPRAILATRTTTRPTRATRFAAGNRLTPEEAYRFARGEEVVSSTGVPVKLSRPLDFLVVSDHAEGLGLMQEVYKGNPAFVSDPTLARWRKGNAGRWQGSRQRPRTR